MRGELADSGTVGMRREALECVQGVVGPPVCLVCMLGLCGMKPTGQLGQTECQGEEPRFPWYTVGLS